MTEIKIILDSINKRGEILNKYREMCHSYVASKKFITLNFVDIKDEQINEMKELYNVEYVLRGIKHSKTRPRVRRGEIYKANLTYREGKEIGNSKFVFIVQNDRGNDHSRTTIILPMVRYNKEKYDELRNYIVTIDSKQYVILVNNLRTIDYGRIEYKVGSLNGAQIKELEEKLMNILF